MTLGIATKASIGLSLLIYIIGRQGASHLVSDAGRDSRVSLSARSER
jgi:hypothetical protein